ncbi:MAG: 30S ribosomal protein S17 [Nitriliruptor sp.]|uniref:30S ribosomal protein S17 n=1 Tax=Nitriliruptor sp. TaxID=2448056 RepID=UPI00349FE993
MSDNNAVPAERTTSRKVRQGVVVSDVQDKTIIVRVERRTTHPLYGKSMKVSKKYHVHDETNDAGVGDTVRIAETRPISKLKRWRLQSVVERAK